jgi:membrane peptidoglycan carboxypeptidase
MRVIARLASCCLAAGLILAGVMLPVVGGAGLFARAATGSFTALPAVLDAPPPPERSRLLDAAGNTIAQFFLQDRIAVPLSQIAPVMQNAVIAIEDARFFHHGAIDVAGTVRAAIADLRHGGTVQGGSTLTQQYVKNVLLYSGDRAATSDSLGRKVREIRYAIAVEQHLTKSQILDRYLNVVYFGEGAYGVEAAARRYFGVHAWQLTLPQAALLAGIVQSPSAYDPVLNPEDALARRAQVLTRMAQVGDISAVQARQVAATPLRLHLHAARFGCALSPAPFFCDWVHHLLLVDRALGATPAEREQRLMTGGLTIRTTLVPHVQSAAQSAVSSVVPPGSRVAAAIDMVQPGTGAVLGMAVDRVYGSGRGQTRVDLAAGGQSGFQAGSTFKLFTLAAAVQQHVPLSTTLYAPPHLDLNAGAFHDCAGDALGPWSVSNAEDGEGGTFGLVRATWESVNTYFAQLELRVGVCAPWRLAKAMGITEVGTGQPPEQVPSFTLGADDTSPLQVAGAYATFAARGVWCRPQGIVSITDAAGKLVQNVRPDCHRVLSQDDADTVTSVLRGVIDGPDPLRTGASAGIGRPAAGKTGTTNSFGAAWFSGFTPQLAASVWVGDPRGGSTYPLKDVTVAGTFYPHVFGADLPASVWRTAMVAALAGVPVQQFQGIAAHIAADQMTSFGPRRRTKGTKSPAPPAPPHHHHHGG